MRANIIVLICACLFLVGACHKNSRVDKVDPFIGTDFFAHTFPGAAVPFGMVQLSPDVADSGWPYCSGYLYKDNSIMGFSHQHFSGTGWPGGGEILFMPTVSNQVHVVPGSNSADGYRSRFDHEKEEAAPGYYSVLLKDYDIQVELTATRRTGFHRYTFPKTNVAHVIIDLEHVIGSRPDTTSHISIKSSTVIEGYKTSLSGTVYFSAEFSKPFAAFGTWDANYRTPESGESLFPYRTAETGKAIGAFVNYSTGAGEKILVKVGISYVSIAGARDNLARECPGWDFDRVRRQAADAWNEQLSCIDIQGGSKEQRQIFYTALYHALLAQYISNDGDGRYLGMDDQIHVAEGYDFFPSFFAWDTFRSEHPLLTLMAPHKVNDMMKSIVDKCNQYGWLPGQHVRNNFSDGMVGDHLVPIVVDAFVKGFRDFDVEGLYRTMKRKATQNPPEPHPLSEGRLGLLHYQSLGYTPADLYIESVSNTLELAYDDWCLAQFAHALGKSEDAADFSKRSGYYANLFDPETQFMRPRLADGSWLPLCDKEPSISRSGEHRWYDCFDPLWIGRRPNRHYAESNAWQYVWSVPHDVEGLIGLFGGKEKFVARLDTFFAMTPEITGPKYVGVVGTIGQYVHGNQPSHHVPYLYDYAGAPWKTQERVRYIMEQLYRTGPGGICGNEDMGSLSSWYVFSALGFYPVCPGQGRYAIGSPLFEKAVIHLQSPYKKGQFVIRAPKANARNKYIQSARLNGKILNAPWLLHSDIVAGGTLELEMGPEPNKSWGAEAVKNE